MVRAEMFVYFDDTLKIVQCYYIILTNTVLIYNKYNNIILLETLIIIVYNYIIN